MLKTPVRRLSQLGMIRPKKEPAYKMGSYSRVVNLLGVTFLQSKNRVYVQCQRRSQEIDRVWWRSTEGRRLGRTLRGQDRMIWVPSENRQGKIYHHCRLRTYPRIVGMYAGSRMKRLVCEKSRVALTFLSLGGSRVLMIEHAITKSPRLNPALARNAFANPMDSMRWLSMNGWMIVPIHEPDEAIPMAKARRLSK